MNTSIRILAPRIKCLAGAALMAGTLLITGCVSPTTGMHTGGQLSQVHADVVYVYTFDAASDEVKLDSGLPQQLATIASGTSTAAQQQQTALKAREQLAGELVRTLQSMGLPAIRMDGPAPAGRNALIVEGHFEKIDAGSRRRRILIGLGAGKSDVGAAVTVRFQRADGASQPLVAFSAEADSGYMPGVAETGGAGAAASHLSTTTEVGGGLHGASEAKHDTVSADTVSLARSIAKQLATLSAENGWLPKAATHQ
jgi:hypothetical protein